MEPGDADIDVGEAGIQEEGIVGAASGADDDADGVEDDIGGGFDEVAEPGCGARVMVGVAPTKGEDAVEGDRHQRPLQIDIAFHRYGGGECTHMEQFNGLGDGVFDHHASGVAVHQLAGGGGPMALTLNFSFIG